MLPSSFRVTAEGHRLHLLGPVQLTEGGREQESRVVHQSSLRLKPNIVKVPFFRLNYEHFNSIVYLKGEYTKMLAKL